MSLPTEPGPVAPYNNYPVQSYFYEPNVFTIANIALGINTLVTTTTAVNYVVGQIVRLIIPTAYRAIQLDQRQGIVIDIPSANQILINIDSTDSNTFDPAPVQAPTSAQVVAIGDYNSGQINTSRSGQTIYVPGSFINVSP